MNLRCQLASSTVQLHFVEKQRFTADISHFAHASHTCVAFPFLSLTKMYSHLAEKFINFGSDRMHTNVIDALARPQSAMELSRSLQVTRIAELPHGDVSQWRTPNKEIVV